MRELKQKPGDVVIVDYSGKTELRKITDIVLNADGKPQVAWESKKGCGVCVPSVWDRWEKDGVDPYG